MKSKLKPAANTGNWEMQCKHARAWRGWRGLITYVGITRAEAMAKAAVDHKFYVGTVDWRVRPHKPVSDRTVERKEALNAALPWSYSTYRALLKFNGLPFAICSPDGSNELSLDVAEKLIAALNR